ncbi:MAG: glycosyltransferase, partial [Herbiconiux sp.]|nr:glycosyltransferase [Herbiconiux sp.]
MREPNGSEPLSIGIACSSRELFGADRSAVRLAKVLRSLGHEPTLLLPEQRPERGLTSHAEAAGIETRTAPIAVASNAGIDGLTGRLKPQRRDRFDVLIYNTSAVLSVAARADRTVTIIREWLNPSDRRHRAVASVHGRRSDAVVAISTGVAAQWKATNSRGPAATIIPNWLSCDALDDGRSLGGDGILCVGRFNRWKGQGVLASAYADAFGGTDEQRPQLCFVGAEPGSEHARFSEDVERQGQSTGLWEVKPFTPDPTPELAASALLVVPSLQPEPFGMVILEALN